MRPYLRAANVSWEGLRLDDVKEMNFSPGEVKTFELMAGDLVLGEASGSPAEVGKAAIWKNQIKGCCFQNTLIRVRPSHRVESIFLLHYFGHQALSGAFARASRGVGIHHLGAQTLASWQLPVPPIEEQRRIVAAIEEHFSHLDDGASLLQRARMRLERMRTSVLAAVTPYAGERTTLGEIADIVGGVTKDSKRQADPSFVEVPYLRVANVQRGYLDLDEITTIRVPPEKAKALRLERGDILFNEGGDRDKLGRGWVWEGEIEGCIHQNHVFRARLRNCDFDPRYISFHGNAFGREWFEKMGKQTTNLASLNLTTLRSFPVPDLPIDEQRRIVEEVQRRLSLQDALMKAIDEAVIRANSLRRSILATAYSGHLVSQEAR